MSACCVNNINRHSRQRQSSPRRALTLRSLLPLTSPPIKDVDLGTDVVWKAFSRTHPQLPRPPSQMLFDTCLPVPIFCFFASPFTSISLSLFPPSLGHQCCFSLHLLFFPPQFPFLTSPVYFSPSFQTFPLCSTQIFFSLCSSISPRCFRAQTISPADAIKLKSLLRQEKYLLFGLGGPVTVIRLQPA